MTTSSDEHVDVLSTSDADLILAVRSGDLNAYGALFERHSSAAHRLARQLVRSADSDDLVAESFTRVLATIQKGKGPKESFRAYLLTAMRHMHVDRAKAAQRVRATDDEAELDRHVDWVDPAEMRFEQSAAAQAFASLPERWQMVLWHLDVEGQKPADIAPLLAMSPNSVSALAYRAREGLRQAYVQGHLSRDQSPDCATTTSQLGAHVRGGLSSRDAAKVESHLDTCARCLGLSLELAEVNQHLSGLLGPALLGVAAAGYLAGGTGVFTGFVSAGAGAKAVLVGTSKAVVAPVKTAGITAFASGAQGVVAAAVTVAVVGAGAVAITGGFTPKAPATTQVSAAAPMTTAPTMSAPVTPTPSIITPTPQPEPEPTTPQTTPPQTSYYVPPQGGAQQVAMPQSKPPSEPKSTTQPTDYGIARINIVDSRSPLQRSISASISAKNSGLAAAQEVQVTFSFARPVEFRGGADGWSCGNIAPGDQLTVLTCRSVLSANTGGTLTFSVAGTTPHGTASVASKADPQPSNDRRDFVAPVWTAK